jgi:small subunit ribosomal protein S13
MLRIAGVNIPPKKHLEIGLTAIYGIGRNRAKAVCNKVGIEYSKKAADLTEKEEDLLRAAVTEFEIEGDLRRSVSMNIKRLMDISSYRGRRHRVNLPCRGQRTRTNAKTRKKRGGKK